MFKLLLVLLCLPLSLTCSGQELIVYGVNRHFQGGSPFGEHVHGYNEHNNGLGYEAGGWGIGWYRDSYNKPAKTVYKAFYSESWNDLRVGVRVGYLDGSGVKGLMLLPTVRYKYFESSYIPAIANQHDGVVGLWLRLPIN
jgi:hypothetical protein